MTSLIKCSGIDCPLRELCERFTNGDNQAQQPWLYPRFDKVKGRCPDFMPNTTDMHSSEPTTVPLQEK